MKIALMLTFIALGLCSCGIKPLEDLVYKKQGATRQHDSTDPSFASYVQTFETKGQEEFQNSGFKVSDVPINFGDTENPDFDGVCFVYEDGSKEIIIKREFWNRADETKKEILIIHELGHCVLGREHDDHIVYKGSTKYKLSMMNPVVPNSNHYQEFKKEYLLEFYREDKKPLMDRINPPSE